MNLMRMEVLKRFYFGEEGDKFLELLRVVTGTPTLHRLADPLGASINDFRPGMEHGFHFDESEFTVTICLQDASSGGEFVHSKAFRDPKAEIQPFEIIEYIMNDPSAEQKLDLAPGTLSIFAGSQSLHKDTRVEGNRDRLMAVLCFSSNPGMRNSEVVQKHFLGRSKFNQACFFLERDFKCSSKNT